MNSYWRKHMNEFGFLDISLQWWKAEVLTQGLGYRCIKRPRGFNPVGMGRITLEIRNSGPLIIELTPAEDMPCQLTFFQLTSELSETLAYGARATDIFQNQTRALPITEG